VGKEFANAQQIRDVYFSQWNQILVEESKYSLEKPLRKKTFSPN
jgi:hypothetical protein